MDASPRFGLRFAVTLLLALALAAPLSGALPSRSQEPNDTFAQAIEIVNDTADYNGTLSISNNVDMYKILLNRTPAYLDHVLAQTNKTSAGGQIRASLYDTLGYRLSWNSTAGTGIINVSGTSPATGYVYIVVLLWASNVAVDYELNVTRTNLTQNLNLLDGDNLPSEAVAVQNGYRNDTHLDDTYDAADYYTVNLSAPTGARDVLVVFVGVPLNGDYVVELYRPSNSSYISVADEGNIFTPDYGINETLYYVPQESGDYVIRIWAEHGSGNYTMTVSVFRSYADNDNDLANATTLDKDGLKDGNVSLNYDTEDYYKLMLRSDATVNLSLSVADFNQETVLPIINIWLLDPSLNFVNSSTGSVASKKVGHVVTEPGWYYVKIGAARSSAGSYSLNLTTVQPPEVLQPEVTVLTDEDTSASVDLGTVFRDPRALPLVFNFTPALHLNLSLNGSNLTLAPQPDWSGREVLSISAANVEAKLSTALLNITVRPVNDAPRALHSDLNFTTDEDAPFGLPMSVYALFYDVDGDTLAYSVTGTLNLTITIDANGIVNVTPARNWNGAEQFNLVATDQSGLSAQVAVSIRVLAINDAPVVIWTPGNMTFPEDTATTLVLGNVFRDPDGDPLVFSAVGSPVLGVTIVNGTATVKSNYQYWWGNESIVFIARDPSNASAAVVINFTITHVNHGPMLWRSIPNMLIQENQIVRLFNLSSYIRDLDGDTLTYTVDGALYVGVTIGADGWVTFSPSSNWSGSETFKFVGEDPAGFKVSTVFNLTVEPVNSAPELSHPAVSPAKGDSATSFTFTVVCRDIDSANVTVKLVVGRRILVMERVSGNLSVGATYQVRTTLAAGENSFYFQVDDGEKSHATSSQELSVTAQPTDNTVIYLGLGVITIVVILLALVFTPSRKKRRWEELDEEE